MNYLFTIHNCTRRDASCRTNILKIFISIDLPCASQARARMLCATFAVYEYHLRTTTLHCKAKRKLSSHFRTPSSHSVLRKAYFISSYAALQQLLTHSNLLQRENFTHRGQKLLHTEALTHTKFLYREAFHIEARSFCTQNFLHKEAFAQRSQELLHTEAFTHTRLFHREAFHTEARSFCTQNFYTKKLLHREARSFCTQKFLHTQQTFTQKSVYTEMLLRTQAFTHRSCYAQKLLHKLVFFT